MIKNFFLVAFATLFFLINSKASDLIEVQPVTRNIIVLRFDDGFVKQSGYHQDADDEVIDIDELDIALATNVASYTISSTSDMNYSTGLNPTSIGRKSKPDDVSNKWSDYELAYDHYIYLVLPNNLISGNTYKINTGSIAKNKSEILFTFDEKKCRSNTVHTNQTGYLPSSQVKYGYLYHWMGDKGGVDLSSYVGADFHLLDLSSGQYVYTGQVSFRGDKNVRETYQDSQEPSNFTRADVYECDFSAFNTPGEYLLVVDGIGSSYPFEIGDKIYKDLYYHTTRSLYHQRQGIALVEPYTEWTRPRDHHFDDIDIYYTKYRAMEEESNRPAMFAGSTDTPIKIWGWYHDAADWDGYIRHATVVNDLLLSYEIAPDNYADNDLNIPESGNGIPDIIDEASWLVYFMKRTMDVSPSGGVIARTEYEGLPPTGTPSYEDPMQWYAFGEDPAASYHFAACAAQLAYCLDLAAQKTGDPSVNDSVATLIDYAERAYQWAKDSTRVGDEVFEGGLLKKKRLLAAAWLYKYTGDSKYQVQFITDLPVTSATDESNSKGIEHAIWAYATTNQSSINTTKKQLLIDLSKYIADTRNVTPADIRNLRAGWNLWLPTLNGASTTPSVIESMVAYHLTGQQKYLNVIHTTADFFLGNNPENMTWVTGIGDKKPDKGVMHLDSKYDKKEEMIPGLVPYGPRRHGDRYNYWQSFDNDYMLVKLYPAHSQWPLMETWCNNPHAPSTAEYTVNQNFSVAAAVYGFLSGPATPTYSVNEMPDVTITSPLNNSSYSEGNSILIEASASDDGGVTKVEFYHDWHLLSIDSIAPYSYLWENIPSSGSKGCDIKAIAYDKKGAQRSASTHVRISADYPVGTKLTFPVVDDASIQSHDPSKTINGAEVRVRTTGPSWNSEGFFKFSIPNVTAIDSAKIYLYMEEDEGSADDTHQFVFVGDDSWLESSIKWNNAPDFMGDTIASVKLPVNLLKGDSVIINMTQHVKNQMLEDGYLSFRVISNGDAYVDYAGSEHSNSAYSPKLVVWTGDKSQVVNVLDMVLNKSDVTLKEDEKVKLIPTFTPSNVTYNGIIWKSNNPSIAKVSANGIVTAVEGPGVATITATTVDGGIIKECTVNVEYLNDSPVMNTVNPFILRTYSGVFDLELTGITDSDDNTQDVVVSSVVSSNTSILEVTGFTTSPGDTSAVIKLLPKAGTEGVVQVTVTLTDEGGTDLGGINTKQYTFDVMVTPGVVLPVTADAYVNNKTANQSKNYGTGASIVIKESTTDGSSGYLKFDMSGYVGVMDSAKLFLNCTKQPNSVLKFYSVSNDSWGETTLNWTNRPTEGSEITSATISALQQYKFNVSSTVVNEYAGDKVVSFYLKGATTNKEFNFSSKENGTATVITKPNLILYMNLKPEVEIDSPVSGSKLTVEDHVIIDVDATDDQKIDSVSVFVGDNKVSTLTSAPYKFDLGLMAEGAYSFKAVVYDYKGLKDTSDAVIVNVFEPVPPVAEITSPVNSVIAVGDINIAINASDVDGTVDSVQIFVNGNLVAVKYSSPYTYTYKNATGGIYEIKAIAHDNRGVASTEAIKSVRVNTAPLVSITEPLENSSYNIDNIVNIIVSASDGAGSIDSVAIYLNDEKLAVDFDAPYTFTYNTTNQGFYKLKAEAWDNDQISTISEIVNFSVKPTITPFSGAPISIPGTFNVEEFDNGGLGFTYYESDTIKKGTKYFRPDVLVDFGNTKDYAMNDLADTIVISNIAAGEWCSYTLNVESSGYYKITAQVASGRFFEEAPEAAFVHSRGKLEYYINDNHAGEVEIFNTSKLTNEWFIWVYKQVDSVYLEQGIQSLRWKANGVFNFNTIKIELIKPIVLYTLDVVSGSGDGVYSEGNVVNINAEAAPENWTFVKWSGDVEYVADTSSASTTLIMPAKDITITATYKDTTPVVVKYTLDVISGTGDGEYTEGYVVSINADAAPVNTDFDKWTGDVEYIANLNSASTTLSMPSKDITVTATYKDTTTGTIKYTLDVVSGTGDGEYSSGIVLNIIADVAPVNMIFDKWTGDVENVTDINSESTTLTMPSKNITVTATFKDKPKYSLVVISGTGDGDYFEDNVVNISAEDAPANKLFDRWIGDVENVSNQNSASTTLTMLSKNITITATYKDKPKYSLYVVSGTGDGDYFEGIVVNISADAAPANKLFDKWTGDVEKVADVNSTSTTLTMPSKNIIVTASFKDKPKYSLAVGSGTGDGDYFEGNVVNISAEAAPANMVFDKWTGDVENVADVNSTSTTLTMPAKNITVTASFKDKPKYTLVVSSGTGDGEYFEGNVVNISAEAAPANMTFDKWTGDVENVADVNSTSTTLTMPAKNITVTATYKNLSTLISDISNSELIVYPQPANGIVNFKINNLKVEVLQLIIYNHAGVEIFNNLKYPTGNSFTLKTSELSNRSDVGLYVFKILMDSEIIVGKIILN